jgi:hypothetical protein
MQKPPSLALSPTPPMRGRTLVTVVAVTLVGEACLCFSKCWPLSILDSRAGRQGSELSLEEKPALGFVAEASSARGGRGNIPADQLSGAPFVVSARRHAHGVVTAVEPAGSYAYVTVRTADGGVIVTATLGNGPRWRRRRSHALWPSRRLCLQAPRQDICAS